MTVLRVLVISLWLGCSSDPNPADDEPACVTNADCPGETPNCSLLGACVACDAALGGPSQTQCPQLFDLEPGLCMPDNTCLDEGRVLFATTDDAAAPSDCNLFRPCSLRDALGMVTAERDVIRLEGGQDFYAMASTLIIDKPVVLVVGARVDIRATPVFDVRANLTLIGGEFVTGDPASSLFRCTTAQLTVSRSELRLPVVVESTDCDVALLDSLVAYPGSQPLVHSVGGSVDIQRTSLFSTTSTIVDADRGSLLATRVLSSGDSQDLTSALVRLGEGSITSSTFLGNKASGALIDCGSATRVDSTLVWGNTTALPFTGNCQVVFSDLESGFPGEGNITIDPFDSDGCLTTAISERANPRLPRALDLGGGVRPLGGTVQDIGALELRACIVPPQD